MSSIPVYIQGHKCTVCVSEYLAQKRDWDMLVEKTNAPEPNKEEIRDAITIAPSWQQKEVMGTIVVTCIPLPICMEHLAPAQLSTTERAMNAGLVVPT